MSLPTCGHLSKRWSLDVSSARLLCGKCSATPKFCERCGHKPGVDKTLDRICGPIRQHGKSQFCRHCWKDMQAENESREEASSRG